MTHSKTPARIARRGVSKRDAASILGRSVGWFDAHENELFKAGFPACDPVTRRYDVKAIHAWMDDRAGLSQVILTPLERSRARRNARHREITAP